MNCTRVVCAACGKLMARDAGVGINGVWSHAAPKCLGEVLSKSTEPLRKAGRQLGLFGKRVRP